MLDVEFPQLFNICVHLPAVVIQMNFMQEKNNN